MKITQPCITICAQTHTTLSMQYENSLVLHHTITYQIKNTPKILIVITYEKMKNNNIIMP